MLNAAEINPEDYPKDEQLSLLPHLIQEGAFDVEIYAGQDGKTGTRRHVEKILLFLTKNAEKSAVESVVNWASYSFKERQAFYNSYLAQSGHIGQHGRIDGEAYILCVTQFDEKGLEIIDPIHTSPASLESRSGCLSKQVSRIFDFNTRFKNRLNALFGGIFKTNLIGNEPNGCAPSLLPSGCSGPGCMKFGCGFLSLIFALGMLLWLLRCFLFGDCGNSNSSANTRGSKIVHDTVYVVKQKSDTVNYVDETTNTSYKMVSLPNVQFEKGKAILLNSSLGQLNELANYLLENSDVKAEIIGHTDSDGDASRNKRLSKERAEAVKKYITDTGVAPSRIKATGKGEEEPVTENATAEGRAMNRRVEVKLTQSNTTKTKRTKQEGN